jgi:diguanylate cyclase (GGDEF)-like protein
MSTSDDNGAERRRRESGGGEDWSAGAYMHTRPMAVAEDAPILGVCQVMAQSRLGQMLIVPSGWAPASPLDSPPEPLGIFTERDLIRAFAQHQAGVLGMKVGELMTSPVVTVGPEEDIQDVADLMTLMRVRRLPVVKGGRTVGMLTRGRVMDAQSRRLALMERENAALEERVVHDPLTGLANRVLFEKVLDREMAKAAERGGVVAVLMVDIDHFKRVNDTHGHAVGDVVLRQLAGVMRATLRRADLPARLGGEEFGVVLPMSGRVEPLEAAEKLRLAVEREVFGEAGEALRITISIGCAIAKPGQGISRLVAEADKALYKAKGDGRNRVVMAE